jgi:hypothetical protein
MKQASVTASTVFYVSPMPHGGWAVYGSDIAPPLSTFAARGDALRHAYTAADRATLGEVQVLGWTGAVEEYWVRPSLAQQRPGFHRAVSLS